MATTFPPPSRHSNSDELHLPPGFRFHPTDDELVNHYLIRKCAGYPIGVPIITEIDLYKFDPWQLPDMAAYGEKEWYFFSPRDRKYPNGSRPNRSAGTGYWKATGADKAIGKPKPLGIKKALVFYTGKAPKGIKTNWIMHEYRLANVDRSAGKRTNLRLDDWVLCRIYNKKGSLDKQFTIDQKSVSRYTIPEFDEQEDTKPIITSRNQFEIPSRIQPPYSYTTPKQEDISMMFHFDPSDSAPRCQTTEDSSGHVISSDVTFDNNNNNREEVQSEPKWSELGSFGDGLSYLDTFMGGGTGSDPFLQPVGGGGVVGMHQQDQFLLSSLQDTFMSF